MAIDFPVAPTVGQEHVDATSGVTFIWNGYGWGQKGGASAPVGDVTVSDTAPASPLQGDLWYESDTAILWMWYVDPNSSQWVQAAGSTGGGGGTVDAYTKAESDAKYVELTGDTMTGNLFIEGANLHVKKTPASVGNVAQLVGFNNGIFRWAAIVGDDTAETGVGNAGSNFRIDRYDDAGANLGTALTIDRATGNTALNGALSINGNDAVIWLMKTGAAAENTILGTMNGAKRWDIQLGNATAEGGGSTGSDFFIRRFDDAGAQSNVFSITRSNGTVTCHGSLNVNGDYIGQANTYAGAGIMSKAGATGVWDANPYNFQWTGLLYYWVGDTNCGTIALASDYRIKKDVAPLTSMWDTVKALNPISYTQAEFSPPTHTERAVEAGPLFAADDIERWGFVAHELQETMIESAASAQKDAPNAIQSPNPLTIIAAVTKALQEAMARIEALEAQLAPARSR